LPLPTGRSGWISANADATRRVRLNRGVNDVNVGEQSRSGTCD
jgi:hypothetical protein